MSYRFDRVDVEQNHSKKNIQDAEFRIDLSKLFDLEIPMVSCPGFQDDGDETKSPQLIQAAVAPWLLLGKDR